MLGVSDVYLQNSSLAFCHCKMLRLRSSIVGAASSTPFATSSQIRSVIDSSFDDCADLNERTCCGKIEKSCKHQQGRVFKTTAVSFHRCARQVVVAKISTVYAKPLGLGLGLGGGRGGGARINTRPPSISDSTTRPLTGSTAQSVRIATGTCPTS